MIHAALLVLVFLVGFGCLLGAVVALVVIWHRHKQTRGVGLVNCTTWPAGGGFLIETDERVPEGEILVLSPALPSAARERILDEVAAFEGNHPDGWPLHPPMAYDWRADRGLR